MLFFILRREMYISRRKTYISRRKTYVSRRETENVFRTKRLFQLSIGDWADNKIRKKSYIYNNVLKNFVSLHRIMGIKPRFQHKTN